MVVGLAVMLTAGSFSVPVHARAQGAAPAQQAPADPLKFSHDGPLLLIYQVKPGSRMRISRRSGRPFAPVLRRATKTSKFVKSLPHKVSMHAERLRLRLDRRPRRSATTRWRFCTTPIIFSPASGLFGLAAPKRTTLQQEIRRHGRRGVHRDPAVATNQSRRVKARSIAAFGFSTGRPLRRRPVFFDESKLRVELSEEDL